MKYCYEGTRKVKQIPIIFALALAYLSASQAIASEVNVYTYRQPELIEPLFDQFTEETGIEVNVAFLNKGLVERLQAEGNRSPADLILTVDISRLKAAVDAGVTQAVYSDFLASRIPAEFRDMDNHWFALTLRARIVYASLDRVADKDLTSYEALADPKWQGRICTRSGTHPYNLALVAALIAHHGEEAAREWLMDVKSNLARKPQGNDRAQVKAIWAGECDISLGNTYYMGKMLADDEQKQWANSVRIEFVEFENGGTHMNVSGIAMTKAAPNRDNALRLMEFLTSDTAQKLYAELNYEYPVVPGTALSEVTESWGTFASDGLSLTDIAVLRPAALRLVEEVDFDS